MNDDLRNHTHQRCKHKTLTWEDNQLSLHCYFRSNPSQRGYRKRMIEIWQDCANFQTIRLAVNNKERLVSWRWKLEIHQKINNEQDSNTISDIPSIDKQEQSNRNEPRTSENRNTTQPNNIEQPLTQERKINLKHLKRIMNRKNYLTITKKQNGEESRRKRKK